MMMMMIIVVVIIIYYKCHYYYCYYCYYYDNYNASDNNKDKDDNYTYYFDKISNYCPNKKKIGNIMIRNKVSEARIKRKKLITEHMDEKKIFLIMKIITSKIIRIMVSTIVIFLSER